MDVCDVDGNKFGSIGRVYRHELSALGGETSAAAVGGETPAEASVGTMTRDEILEVKTGVFGLGKHLYVPFSAIQDVTSGCVFINQPKDSLDQQGWDTKPDYFEELS
jgi:hypothetical protein